MKIKHFAGYGCITARKCKDSSPSMLHVCVEGDHEQGLSTHDEYVLYTWLVKRFDKTVPDCTDWIRSRPIIDVCPNWRIDPQLGVIDYCDYYFYYDRQPAERN